MSLESIIEILQQFGLKRTEAQVYVYLDNKGNLNEKEILKGLSINKNVLQKILIALEERGLITSKTTQIREFCAVSFEEVLDRLIEQKVKQSDEILEIKKKIIAVWKK